MNRREFHKLVVRITKAKLVLALLTTLIWGGFPTTTCVCADGTVKAFCTKICGRGKCCCDHTAARCSGCDCRHESVLSTCRAGRINREGEQCVARPCGCHRVAKDSATLLSPNTSAEDDSERSTVLSSTPIKICRTSLGSHLWSNRRDEETNSLDDIPILFCHLTI